MNYQLWRYTYLVTILSGTFRYLVTCLVILKIQDQPPPASVISDWSNPGTQQIRLINPIPKWIWDRGGKTLLLASFPPHWLAFSTEYFEYLSFLWLDNWTLLGVCVWPASLGSSEGQETLVLPVDPAETSSSKYSTTSTTYSPIYFQPTYYRTSNPSLGLTTRAANNSHTQVRYYWRQYYNHNL